MKFQLRAVFLTTLLAGVLLVASSSAFAAGTDPVSRLNQIIKELKSTGSPLAILNYVHWPTAWKNYPLAERDAMEISSPEELKTHFEKVFTDPSGFMKAQIERRMKDLPEERRATMEQSMQRMISVMEEQKTKMKDRLGQTEYKVGEANIAGQSATVPLHTTFNGQTKTSMVKLEQVEGEWYLPSVNFVESQSVRGNSTQPAAPSMR